MVHQARPRLTSLHIGNAYFYLAKEMNFCAKHRIGSSLQLSYPFPVIKEWYPFATAKYQLLYWMEPVELNQRAKLCPLTFLKFLKDKQVLTDMQSALGLSFIIENSFSGIPHTHQGRGSGYLLCCCICPDLQPQHVCVCGGGKVTLSLKMFTGLHEALHSLLLLPLPGSFISKPLPTHVIIISKPKS